MIIHDSEFLPQAKCLISSAKKSIDICTFKAEFTTHHRGRHLLGFFNEIFEKRDTGIPVRFMFNWNNKRRACPSTNKSALGHFKKHKFDVRVLPRDRCCHAKIILVDGKKAIVGSHNLSVSSVSLNFEVSYLVCDPIAVASLQAIFSEVFKGASTI